MKRPASSSGTPSAGGSLEPCEMLVTWPTVVAFLADSKWEDGADREPGTILLVVQDGVAKAWVNDKAAQRSAWLSARSLTGLFDALEEALVSDRLDWRGSKPAAGRGGRK